MKQLFVRQKVDWNAVYADHVGRIYNFFRYRVGDEATAEDLTAATFEKAWKKRRQYRGDQDGFVYWLYAIARNIVRDYFRKQPQQIVALDDNMASLAEMNVTDEVAEKLEFARLVHHIQHLPLREQEIITLKYGADLTNRQIAKQLELSETNIGSILFRTIKKLRQQMETNDE